MNEFLIHVERIVRPIQAMDDRKDRMREELLAHLATSFERERAKHPDEGLASSRAIAGLGDPGQLRNDLQESVSRLERFKARIERIFSWHAPEPAWRYTLRSGAFVGVVFVMLMPIAVLSLLAFGQQAVIAAVRLMMFMGVLTGINVFVLGLLYFKIRDNLLEAFGAKRSWFRLIAYLLASAGMVELSLLLFLWATTGELVGNLPLLLGRSLVAFVLPVIGLIVAWFRGPGELRHTVWECLDISEQAPPPAIAE